MLRDKLRIILTLLISCGFSIYGQSVTGLVTDEKGIRLIGANVYIEGTEFGGATDSKGRFHIESIPPADFVLVVTYIGYQSQRLSLSLSDDLTALTITLIAGELFGQEVVVTARKREETIKEVPISMVAIQEDMIKDLGATSLHELVALVPNVTIVEGQSSIDDFNIRGIAGGARNPGFGSAEGVYLDGVIMGRPGFINFDIVDMQSVEFLRGPQGTLFGRNAISGAINMVSAKPSPVKRVAASADLAQNNYRKIRAMVNLPLTDWIYAKSTLFYSYWDGYLTNSYNGRQEKYDNTFGGRFALRAVPLRRLTIDFSYDFSRDDIIGAGYHVSDWHLTSDAPTLNGTLIDSLYEARWDSIITDEGRYFYRHDTTTYYKRNLTGATLTLNYTLSNDWTLSSITATRSSGRDYFNDEDGIGLHLITGKWDDTGDQISQELRLTSGSGGNLSWVGGLFYFRLTNDMTGPVYPTTEFIYFITSLPPFLTEDDIEDVAPEGHGITTSVGVFGSLDYSLFDRLTFTLGARYTKDTKDMKYRQDGLPAFGYIYMPEDEDGDGEPDGFYEDTLDWSAVTPSVSIKYRFTPLINIYSTVSQGFKSGGYNSDYVSNFESVTEPFDPEFITNYELGIKAGNRTNTAFINAAYFYMDYEDMQVSQFVDLFEGYKVSNAASSTIQGIEADFTARLFQNRLTLMGGFGFTQAVFNKFNDGQGNDFSGQNISYYPRTSWSLVADYAQPLKRGLRLNAQLRSDHIGEVAVEFTTDPLLNELIVDSRTLINGHVGIDAGRFGFYLWGNNLLDTEYIRWHGINGYIGIQMQQWGEPRQLGVRVYYRM